MIKEEKIYLALFSIALLVFVSGIPTLIKVITDSISGTIPMPFMFRFIDVPILAVSIIGAPILLAYGIYLSISGLHKNKRNPQKS